MWGARMEKQTRKRLNEKYGRDETVVWWVELFILHILLLNDVQKTVLVAQIQHITVCDATTSLTMSVSFFACHRTKHWSRELSIAQAILDACEKEGFLGNKKKIWFSNISKKKEQPLFQKKKKSLMALMAFAETETKVIKKPCCPYFTPGTYRFPGGGGHTLFQQHRRHNSVELPNAHAHYVIEPCQGECKNGEISCCQRHHFGVHDGIGHAKPPQFGVGNHHDGRYLLCQRGAVIQSLLCLFGGRTRKAMHTRTRWTRAASRGALGR